MFVKYQINLSTVPSGTTATTINVINMDFLCGSIWRNWKFVAERKKPSTQ
jgi:hypothetical protein